MRDYISLNEAKRNSRTVITRKTKINRAASQLSTNMAKKRNDSLYKLMKKHCDLCRNYRDKIHKKYRSRNISKARR